MREGFIAIPETPEQKVAREEKMTSLRKRGKRQMLSSLLIAGIVLEGALVIKEAPRGHELQTLGGYLIVLSLTALGCRTLFRRGLQNLKKGNSLDRPFAI